MIREVFDRRKKGRRPATPKPRGGVPVCWLDLLGPAAADKKKEAACEVHAAIVAHDTNRVGGVGGFSVRCWVRVVTVAGVSERSEARTGQPRKGVLVDD